MLKVNPDPSQKQKRVEGSGINYWHDKILLLEIPLKNIMPISNKILEKNWLTQMEFDSALTYAINDFKENYAQYINAWENQ